MQNTFGGMNLQNNMLHINQPYAPRLHARSARMRTARHKAPCRFVYNAATAAEMHAPYGRGQKHAALFLPC